MGSPSVSVDLDIDLFPFLRNQDLLFCFMFGVTKYSLDNNYSKDKVQNNLAGVETAIIFYQRNKEVIKKNKEIEKFIKMRKKGKLEEYIRNNIKSK